MKRCEQILKYAQNELSAQDKAAFEEHIKTCESCRAELAFLAKVEEGMQAPAAPARMVEKLFARTTRRRPLWARFRLGWTAAALAACVGVYVVFFPAHRAFNAHELVAYMNSVVEDEYVSFAQELTDMEDYF